MNGKEEGAMKKILAVMLVLAVLCPHGTQAKAVKLGRGQTVSVSAAGNIGGKAQMRTEKDCDPECRDCDKYTGMCKLCPIKKWIYQGKCMACPAHATCDGKTFTCAAGYYATATECVPCSALTSNCKTCTAHTCLSCETNYILKDNQCFARKSCTENCKTCDETTGVCSACDDNSDMQPDGTCKARCPTAAVCAEQNGGTESTWKVENCECVPLKKYILTDEKMTYDGHTLYRIKALRDIPFKYERKKAVRKNMCYDETIYDSAVCQAEYFMTCDAYFQQYGKFPTRNVCHSVIAYDPVETVSFMAAKAGDLGGWIEKEANLTQGSTSGYSVDDGWVAGNAKVYGDARVSQSYVGDEAVVSGKASINSGAYVRNKARISGGSVSTGEVYDNAVQTAGSLGSYSKLYGSAQNNGCMITEGGTVYGNAVVKGCEIHENVEVYGNARIYGEDVRLWGQVKVYDSAKIGTTSQIYIKGKTFIYGNAQVFARKNWTASAGYKHQVLEGNNLKIGGTVKFCDNSKKTGTYTSGTVKGSWEDSCNPTYN